ncbi:MAG: flagellar basal body-associated FliL family protein [Hydrogenophilales bacterium]|jgi:flagellar FliL protein
MAEEEVEQEGGKKGGIVKIIIFAVIGILVLALTVFATLFLSGFFEDDPADQVEQTLDELEKQAEKKESDSKSSKSEESNSEEDTAENVECEEGEDCPEESGPPKRVAREIPTGGAGYVQTYHELTRPFIANLSNSKKVMQITIAVMTQYEAQVTENVDKHEFAIRSVVLDIMRQVSDSDITQPDFRVELAERVRLGINSVLERWENFGGIEEVYFTEFVIQ